MKYYIVYIYILVALLLLVEGKKSNKVKELKCSICEALANEIHDAVAKLHMVEVLETVCKRFDDYAQAVHKTTGRLTVMQLVINGAMNPNFGDYELKQDSELNRSLEFYCNGMVEEYEEDITALYGENPEIGKKDLQKVLCNEMADLCSEQKEEL
ncbi:canopy family protein seele isoform X4 [Oratosquilla oratoria]|uniref:canopy family protein seele isoform X4 n=1 Tax=Oratosquilla oratoria TaxID=337810 RepID=UPI003F76E758